MVEGPNKGTIEVIETNLTSFKTKSLRFIKCNKAIWTCSKLSPPSSSLLTMKYAAWINLLHYGCYWIRANLVLVEFWRKEGKKSNIPRTAPFRAHFRARQQQAALFRWQVSTLQYVVQLEQLVKINTFHCKSSLYKVSVKFNIICSELLHLYIVLNYETNTTCTVILLTQSS